MATELCLDITSLNTYAVGFKGLVFQVVNQMVDWQQEQALLMLLPSWKMMMCHGSSAGLFSSVISSLCLALGSTWVRIQLFPHQIQLGGSTTKQTLLSCYRVQRSIWATLPMLWASSLSSGTGEIYVVSLSSGVLCAAAWPKYSSRTGFWKQRSCSGSVGCWHLGCVGRTHTSIAEQPCPLHITLFWEGGLQGTVILCHRPRCTSTSSLCGCVAKLSSPLGVCLIRIYAD